MTYVNDSHADYSRYFSLKQKVYLINMSEERNREEYQSLSGIIEDRRNDIIELHIPYATDHFPSKLETDKIVYKITTETLGVGLQIIAHLVGIKPNNLFRFQLTGILETYQRRHNPRVDATIKLLNIRQNLSLPVYRKEFDRFINLSKDQKFLSNLKLIETRANLSIGGIRIETLFDDKQSPLSMFIIDLNDNLAPVCAIAETVWSRREGNNLTCAHRFIHILNKDQERIGSYVLALRNEQGLPAIPAKFSWELLDKMIFEGMESKP